MYDEFRILILTQKIRGDSSKGMRNFSLRIFNWMSHDKEVAGRKKFNMKRLGVHHQFTAKKKSTNWDLSVLYSLVSEMTLDRVI